MSIFFEGCNEDSCIFSFLSILDTLLLCILVLWPLDIHCTYIWFIYIYIDVCYSPISPCVVSFLSWYTCFLLLVYNLIFLFHTKMPWWVLFKMFQKYRLSKSTCHKLSSCKVFQEFVLGIDFIVFNKWIWVELFMTSLICSFVYLGFVTDCQRRRLLGHMWIMLGTYVNILYNWLILWQNALYL